MTVRRPRPDVVAARAPRGRWLLVLVLALAGSGCAAGTRYFEPAERVQGQTVQGYRLAIYPLQGPQGAFGEAKIWSSGARESGDRTRVHVGFELHNTSGAPLTMDANDVRLDVRTPSGALKALPPAAAQAHSVAAGALADIDWEFDLPPGVQPADVDALRVHWRVNTPTQSYEQRTPFVREVQTESAWVFPPYSYPCWPYGPYDCSYAYGLRLYDPVVIPRYVPERRVTRSYPNR